MAVKTQKTVRKFKVLFFESEGEDFNDVTKAKQLIESGKKVTAFGDVCNYKNRGDLRVKTSEFERIRVCKGQYELVTSNHIYVVNM